MCLVPLCLVWYGLTTVFKDGCIGMEGDPNRMAWYWMDGSSSVRSVSLVLLSFWSWCLGWVLVPLDVPSRTGFVPRMVRVVYWLLWSGMDL